MVLKARTQILHNSKPQNKESGQASAVIEELNLFKLLGATLKDLILLPNSALDYTPIHIVHGEMFTQEGIDEWKDLLFAPVSHILPGVYGIKVFLKGVCPNRVNQFVRIMQGDCSDYEYNRYISTGK